MSTQHTNGLRPRDFERVLIKLLKAPRGEDFCLNGLQLDADVPISKVLGAVTISDAVINQAIEVGAQAIVVHHGWHWKGEDARVIGPRGGMTRKLLKAGISLFAFHQPLDQSPSCGNNLALAAELGLRPLFDARGELETLCNGSVLLCEVSTTAPGRTAAQIAGAFHQAVAALEGASQNQTKTTLINGEKVVRKVAICTGGAQRLFHDLQRLPEHIRPDMYITGEISLPQFYAAQESDMAFFAGGHHNTEIFGIKALVGGLNKPSVLAVGAEEPVSLTAQFFNDWCPV